MKTVLLLPIAILLSQVAIAQPDGPGTRRGGPGGEGGKAIVVGTVLDRDSGSPLDFATISLLDATDSTLVTGGVTQANGKFSVDAPYGPYVIKIEYLAYEGIFLPKVTLSPDNQRVNLGQIELGPSAQVLDEVKVVAEKSEMQFNLDKRVFNVGKDLANRGGAADELLDNIPSVTVDAEGAVSLRGSENVRILVDGKPSGLVGIGDSDGLKSLPSSMIEKVEIVTNASARYEAEGTAGIINIVLKKEKQKGINGAIDVSAGIPKNYGVSLNLNARKKNINYFVNYGFRNRTGPGRSETTQQFFNDVEFPFNDQIGTRDRGGVSHSIRGGLDLYITEKDVLTGSIMYRYGDDFSKALTTFRDYDANRQLQRITTREQDEVETEPNLEYDLTFEHKFAEKDHKLTAQVQYRNSSEVESADFIDQHFLGDGSSAGIADRFQRSENDEKDENILLQLDYIKPIGENSKFELGARSTLRNIRNNYFLEEQLDNGWSKLPEFTNNFIYDEDIAAAYAIFGSTVKKWSYQIGLRLEHSHVVTELENTNEINDRNYTNLFPSAHLTYEFDPGNSVQISYSSRISRPRFWYLNPFFTFSNNRRIWGGNPNLDPEFTDSYEIGYLRYLDNVTFGSSIYYRHTTGVIERLTTVDLEGITRTRPENLAISDAIGVEFTTTADVSKKMRFDFSANLYRAVTEGQFNDQELYAEAFSLSTRLNARYQFWEDAQIQIRSDYRAPENGTQGRRRGYWGVDLTFSKDIIEKKGTITVGVRDVFFTRLYRHTTSTPELFAESLFQRRARNVTATFNYRLNQKKQRGRPERNGDFEGGEQGF